MTPAKISLPNQELTARIVAAALAEDIGSGDVTTNPIVPEGMAASGVMAARESLVFCGAFIVEAVLKKLDAECTVTPLLAEGERAEAGQALVRVEGKARALLTGERVALNLLQRMCGVATLTAQYVDAVKGTKAQILDTRKTMPLLRPFDKYAVRCGGGVSHRSGLYDMVLIKDNHIALAGGIRQAVEKVRESFVARLGDRASPERASCGMQEAFHGANEKKLSIEVECDTVRQVEEALKLGVDRIMLDNMSSRQLKEAVALVEMRVPLEASGNASLENVRKIAETGVDFISVGRLTHSAPAVDIGFDIDIGT